MANFVSPGVYTIEKDISDYTPSINTSIVGIVGFADKGPVDLATLVTSQNNLLRAFGSPSEAIPGQGIEGALEILEATNQVYFVRAAAEGSADASATVALGSCPSFVVSGNAGGADALGIDRPYKLRIQVRDENGVPQFTDNGGAGRDFTMNMSDGASQAAVLRSVIGGSLDSDKVGVVDAAGFDNSGLVAGSFAGSKAAIEVAAFDLTGGALSILAAVDPATGEEAPSLHPTITAFGADFKSTGADSVAYAVESLYPGAGYNAGIKTNGDLSGNTVTVDPLGGQNFTVVINEEGSALENFKGSLVASGAFLEDVINTGEVDAVSEVIKGNIVVADADVAVTGLTSFYGSLADLVGAGDVEVSHYFDPADPTLPYSIVGLPTTSTVARTPRMVKPIGGTIDLAGGNSGFGADEAARSTALIGDATLDPKTGMQALDDRVLNIGLALVPGIQTEAVQNALVTLAEGTQDFLALVAPPYAVGTAQDAIDWSNGRSATTGSRTSALNSSYAAIHWPWVKVFSTFDGLDRWFDPSIFAARQMAYTDAVSDSWFAPAGFRRGRLTKPTEVEVKLNQGDRDSLYSGGNCINPVVAFPQQGITIFGQRTAQREPTALDRINVRRLMIYIRKIILLSTQRFVFEPNDEFTWAEIEGVLNPFLDDIRRRRGITEFRVVCDETTNTPVRVDRNELWTKVLIKPTKTAEILVFEINLTNQSANLGNI